MPQAVIFDMDGMLTDSEPLWRIASVEVLNGIGVPLTEEDAVATTGLRTDELVETWQRTYPWEGPPRKVVEAMIESRVTDLIRTIRPHVEHVLSRMQNFKILRNYRRAASTLADLAAAKSIPARADGAAGVRDK